MEKHMNVLTREMSALMLSLGTSLNIRLSWRNACRLQDYMAKESKWGVCVCVRPVHFHGGVLLVVDCQTQKVQNASVS